MFEVLCFSAAVAGIALALSIWNHRRQLRKILHTVTRTLGEVGIAFQYLGAAAAMSADATRAFARQMERVRELCGQHFDNEERENVNG